MTQQGRLFAGSLLMAVLACSEEPVRRHLVFALAEEIPQATSLVVGETVRLETAHLESLADGLQMFAWSRTGSTWMPKGTLKTGRNELPGTDWPNVEELLVTVEVGGRPSTPSTLVLFRGRLGESLSFGGYGGPGKESLARSQVTVDLVDDTLTALASGLPSPGAAAFYGIWGYRAGNATRGEDSTFLGRLVPSGGTISTGQLLATFTEIEITLELEKGVSAQGGVVLRAPVYVPGGAAQAPAGHQH